MIKEILVMICIACFLISFILFGKIECYAKTKGLGLNVKWGITSGCLIEPVHGVWVPLKNYVIIR